MPVGTSSSAFVHNLNKSAAETGGPDCLKCHASTASMLESEGTPMDMRINKTAFTNFSVHRDINSNAVSTVTLSDNRSKACWICHGDGNQPIKHHTDYMTPKGCHNSNLDSNNLPAPVNLHNSSIGIYMGNNACYTSGCHEPPPPCDERCTG